MIQFVVMRRSDKALLTVRGGFTPTPQKARLFRAPSEALTARRNMRVITEAYVAKIHLPSMKVERL